VVSAVAVVAGAATLVLLALDMRNHLLVTLGPVTLMVGAASLIATYFLTNAVKRFERLDAGVAELARWWIDPPAWRQFAAADRARKAGLEPHWGENVLIVAEEIAAPVEIVVSREAVRVGEAYHELDRDIMLGTRHMPGTPVMLEFYFKIIKPRGLPVPFIVRFPVAAGAEDKARTVLAHYNKPIKVGPIAQALILPGQAARRHPRKARNIALIVAAVGAALATVAILLAEPPPPRAWEQPDTGVDLVVLGVGLGAFLAVPALLLALIFHLRMRGAR
jgi:hypothetical protein